MTDVAANLDAARARIDAACARAGRDPGSVELLPVSKTHPIELIRVAHAAGYARFGESRPQELEAKAAAEPDLGWVFIGHLQTNKAKSVRSCVTLVHSVDRIDLARALGRLGPARPLDVLVQVNTTQEATKSGSAPGEVEPLIEAIREEPSLRLRGFMTIGPLDGTEADNRRAFALLRSIRDRSAAAHRDLALEVLSMGMSDDFPEAITEGATLLRIGSRIFGAR